MQKSSRQFHNLNDISVRPSVSSDTERKGLENLPSLVTIDKHFCWRTCVWLGHEKMKGSMWTFCPKKHRMVKLRQFGILFDEEHFHVGRNFDDMLIVRWKTLCSKASYKCWAQSIYELFIKRWRTVPKEIVILTLVLQPFLFEQWIMTSKDLRWVFLLPDWSGEKHFTMMNEWLWVAHLRWVKKSQRQTNIWKETSEQELWRSMWWIFHMTSYFYTEKVSLATLYESFISRRMTWKKI